MTPTDDHAPSAPRRWPGWLVSLEGVDGAGKSTQAALLASRLSGLCPEVVSVREPGATELGRDVREIVLHRGWEVGLDAWAESLLLVAARAQLLAQLVVPALERGALVLCDRFVDSTLAYQGVARGVGIDALRRLHRDACHDVWPDLTLLFDLSPEAAMRRRMAAELPLDRMEVGGETFLTAVALGYDLIATEEPRRIARIDAARAPAEVASAVAETVASRLGLRGPRDRSLRDGVATGS